MIIPLAQNLFIVPDGLNVLTKEKRPITEDSFIGCWCTFPPNPPLIKQECSEFIE